MFSDENNNFGGKMNWQAGFEMEYYLPFNRNTWSLLLVPTYENTYFSNKFNGITRTLKENSIDFPIGGRYTKYFKNDFKYYFDVMLNSPLYIKFDGYYQYNNSTILKTSEGIGFIVGGGVDYKT